MKYIIANKQNIEAYLTNKELLNDLLARISERMRKKARYPNQKKKEVQMTF